MCSSYTAHKIFIAMHKENSSLECTKKNPTLHVERERDFLAFLLGTLSNEC